MTICCMGKVGDLENLHHHLVRMKEAFAERLMEIDDLKINFNHVKEIEDMGKQAAGIIAEVKRALHKAEEEALLMMEYPQRVMSLIEAMIKELEDRIRAAELAAKAGQCCQGNYHPEQTQKQAEKQVTSGWNNNTQGVCDPQGDHTQAAGDSSCVEGAKKTSGPASCIAGQNMLPLAGGKFAIITGAILIAVAVSLIHAGQVLAGTVLLLTGVTIVLF